MKNAMRQTVSAVVTATLGLSALMACSPKEKVNEKQKVVITANRAMAANELAEAGEQLVGPYTYPLADRVFEMALEKDPENKKAQFYRALLKPNMVLKGLGTRLKPLVRKIGDAANFEKNLNDFPNAPLKKFFLDGKEDIKTYADAQNLLVDVRNAWSDLHRFIKKNANSTDLVINLNPHIWEQRLQSKAKENCVVVERGEDDYHFECDFTGIAQVRANSADMIVLQQMAAGMSMMFDLYTTYSIEGIDSVSPLLQDPNISASEAQRILESVPTIGKLHKRQNLSRILGYGADLASGLRWAVQYQDRLCAKGDGEVNRPGHVVEQGICTDKNEALKTAALIDIAVKGPFERDITDEVSFETRKVTLNVARFLTNLPTDARKLAPATYNKCGTAASLRDNTFGGLFVNGDAATVLLSPCYDSVEMTED